MAFCSQRQVQGKGCAVVHVWAVVECAGVPSRLFSFMMHAGMFSHPHPPGCHRVGLLEAVALGRGMVLAPGWLWAMKACHRGFLYLHFMPSHQVWPVFGKIPACTAPFRAGSQHVGCGVVTGPPCPPPPPPYPPGSYPLQEPPLWKAQVVLTGASLWYLKREYPLYVHFINGECTGETLICVSN